MTELWKNITPKYYEKLRKEFKHKLWNFQLEATKYCLLDCVCLHQVLTIFNDLICDKIIIHSALTIPALAMKKKTRFAY